MLFGNDTALVRDENRITHKELFDQINALASGFASKGITRGDRIGILSLNHEKFFHIFGAAAALGAIVSPINWRLSNEEIQYILQDSSPSVIVVDKKHESKIQALSKNSAFIFHQKILFVLITAPRISPHWKISWKEVLSIPQK